MTIISSFILGLFVGLLLTKIFNWIGDKKKNSKISEEKSFIRYQPENDNLYMLNKWSHKRPLLESNHNVFLAEDRPKQNFIPKDIYKKSVKHQIKLNRSGDICYLTDYQIDHQESTIGNQFNITIAPCDYSEYCATVECLKDNPDLQNQVNSLIHNNPKGYLKKAFPSNVTVNVVVINKSNFLAMKRSGSVDSAKNIWSAGPFETMTLKKNEDSYQIENIFDLSRRCLYEELNLSPLNYKNMFISWFGLYSTIVRTHIVCIVEIDGTTEDEVIKKAMNSKSNFETSDFEWLPLTFENIKNFVENDSGNLKDRDWLIHTKLSLSEAIRVKSYD